MLRSFSNGNSLTPSLEYGVRLGISNGPYIVEDGCYKRSFSHHAHFTSSKMNSCGSAMRLRPVNVEPTYLTSPNIKQQVHSQSLISGTWRVMSLLAVVGSEMFARIACTCSSARHISKPS